MFGAAHVARDGSNLMTGMILPSAAADPTENLRAGMLAYNTTLGAMRLYLDGAWKSVELES